MLTVKSRGPARPCGYKPWEGTPHLGSNQRCVGTQHESRSSVEAVPPQPQDEGPSADQDLVMWTVAILTVLLFVWGLSFSRGSKPPSAGPNDKSTHKRTNPCANAHREMRNSNMAHLSTHACPSMNDSNNIFSLRRQNLFEPIAIVMTATWHKRETAVQCTVGPALPCTGCEESVVCSCSFTNWPVCCFVLRIFRGVSPLLGKTKASMTSKFFKQYPQSPKFDFCLCLLLLDCYPKCAITKQPSPRNGRTQVTLNSGS